MALITAGAVLIGIVAIAASLLLNQPPSAAHLVALAEPAPASLASGMALGSAAAKVTVDVYADYQCPNCRAYAEQVEPRLVNQYVRPGSARMVFHDLAFLGTGSDPAKNESIQAAVAARCAEDQGRFWSYQEYLFANQGPAENGGTYNRTLFDAIAERIGINRTTFDSCIADPVQAKAVQSDTAAALQAGIHQTPTLIVNGTTLGSWGLQAVSAAIDAALAGAGPGPSAASSAGPSSRPSSVPSPTPQVTPTPS